MTAVSCVYCDVMGKRAVWAAKNIYHSFIHSLGVVLTSGIPLSIEQSAAFFQPFYVGFPFSSRSMVDTIDTRQCYWHPKFLPYKLLDFFCVGLPKEDYFFDHLLWSIFQSTGTFTDYNSCGPLRAAFMYFFNSLSLQIQSQVVGPLAS